MAASSSDMASSSAVGDINAVADPPVAGAIIPVVVDPIMVVVPLVDEAVDPSVEQPPLVEPPVDAVPPPPLVEPNVRMASIFQRLESHVISMVEAEARHSYACRCMCARPCAKVHAPVAGSGRGTHQTPWACRLP